MGVEQGVGDFRALLQPRRMAAGIAWRVLRQSPGCSSKRMRMLRMLRTCRRPGRSGQADAQLFLHAPQQVFQVFRAAQGFQ